MKRLILAIIAILMIISGIAMIASGQEIDVDISTDSDEIAVVETHTFDSYDNDIVTFWIQSGHSEAIITLEDSVITTSQSSNIYTVNLSEYNITSGFDIKIEYSLAKTIETFEKSLQYDTTSLTVTFDGSEIYSGATLNAGSSIDVTLQKEQQGETITVTVETIPVWVYGVIGVLAVLVIFLAARSTAKPKSSADKKSSATGTKEFFTTNKTLLMETLKEIEKLHRGKKISDETYHKLKDRYKQEAVDTMKNLEDIK